MEWDELRYFHAVAQAGSLSQAARHLGVSQPTVGRKIKVLEARLEARLFDRLASGYALTEAGRRIFDKAREMADAARCIADRVSGEATRVDGAVTLTTSEGLGSIWMAPRLSTLKSRYPDLDVRLAISNTFIDVSNGGADIALRLGDPRDETLIGRRIATVAFRLFASREYLAAWGIPASLGALSRHSIIESGGCIAATAQARRLREVAGGARRVATLDNIVAQLAAARAGLGLVALPRYMTWSDEDLVCVLPEEFCVHVPAWLLTREDLRGSVRVRAVMDFVTGAVRGSWAAWNMSPSHQAVAAACVPPEQPALPQAVGF